MTLRSDIKRLAGSLGDVTSALERLNDQVDRVAEIEITAPASFAPVPPPFPAPIGAVAPGGPVQVGTEGAPRLGTAGGGGAGRQFVTVGSPLIYSMSGGGPAMTREDLEQFATKMDLPSGGWVYVFAGYLYPGSGGVLATTGARAGGGGGGGRGSGRNAVAPDRTGNQDRSRTFTVADNQRGRGRAGAASSTDIAGLGRSLGARLDAIHRELQRSRGADAATASRVSR